MTRLAHSRILRQSAKTFFAAADIFFGAFPGPRILIYHQVGTDLGREMEVSLQTFRRHLEIIGEYGEVVELESAIAHRSDEDSDRLVVLTFDDGFSDVYANAFPLLADRNWPFTLYLTTEPLESGKPLDNRFPDARPLSWDQVKEMVGTGLVTVGAHTHTHSDLRMLAPDQIASELDASNRIIEMETGVFPRHFAYPWGRWASAADPQVRQSYQSATVGGGGPFTLETDLYAIPRLPVQKTDGIRFFRRKLQTGLRAEDRVRALLGR